MDYVKENILKPGTRVKLKKEFGFAVEAVIKGVWIGTSSIEYQIAYFCQGTFKAEYIPFEMFEVAGEPLPTGFQLTKQ